MEQLQRIENKLQVLTEKGAHIYMFKSKKYWVLMFKENDTAKTEFVMGLNDIERFIKEK